MILFFNVRRILGHSLQAFFKWVYLAIARSTPNLRRTDLLEKADIRSICEKLILYLCIAIVVHVFYKSIGKLSGKFLVYRANRVSNQTNKLRRRAAFRSRLVRRTMGLLVTD